MDLQLQGKRSVVLGGSRGIGRAIALALAAEGADVAVCARGAGVRGRNALREVEESLRDHGRRVHVRPCDLGRRGRAGRVPRRRAAGVRGCRRAGPQRLGAGTGAVAGRLRGQPAGGPARRRACLRPGDPVDEDRRRRQHRAGCLDLGPGSQSRPRLRLCLGQGRADRLRQEAVDLPRPGPDPRQRHCPGLDRVRGRTVGPGAAAGPAALRGGARGHPVGPHGHPAGSGRRGRVPTPRRVRSGSPAPACRSTAGSTRACADPRTRVSISAARVRRPVVSTPIPGEPHDHRHRPPAPRAALPARAHLPRLPRRRSHGQVAATVWLHRPRRTHGRPRGRPLPDGVHQLRHRPQPFLRRRIPGAGPGTSGSAMSTASTIPTCPATCRSPCA